MKDGNFSNGRSFLWIYYPNKLKMLLNILKKDNKGLAEL